MNNPIGGKKPPNRMIWLLGLVVLFAVLAFMFARPLGESESGPATPPSPQSTEWVEDAKGPAVPVELPTTPLKAVPEAGQDEAGREMNKVE